MKVHVLNFATDTLNDIFFYCAVSISCDQLRFLTCADHNSNHSTIRNTSTSNDRGTAYKQGVTEREVILRGNS